MFWHTSPGQAGRHAAPPKPRFARKVEDLSEIQTSRGNREHARDVADVTVAKSDRKGVAAPLLVRLFALATHLYGNGEIHRCIKVVRAKRVECGQLKQVTEAGSVHLTLTILKNRVRCIGAAWCPLAGGVNKRPAPHPNDIYACLQGIGEAMDAGHAVVRDARRRAPCMHKPWSLLQRAQGFGGCCFGAKTLGTTEVQQPMY